MSGGVTFSHLSGKVRESQVVAVRRSVARRQAAGQPVYSFILGDNPLTAPRFIREAAKAALDAGQTKYTLPEGWDGLRLAVIKDFERLGLRGLGLENLIITDGGLEAIFLALRCVCDPGSEVIVPSPYYMFYPDQVVSAAGAVPRFIETTLETGFKVTPELLERAITPRTRAFIFNHPNNPTGIDYTLKEMRALAEVGCGRSCLYILDEVYERFVYDGTFTAFAAVNPDMADQILTVNSASKSFGMSGERIGWAAGPAELIARMVRFKNYSSYGAPSVGQRALAATLENPDQVAADVDAMVAAFRIRRDATVRGLTKIGLPFVQPVGAFYAFPKLPPGLPGSMEFTLKLLDKTGVAVGPGVEFGRDDHIRLAFVVDEPTIEAGLEILGNELLSKK